MWLLKVTRALCVVIAFLLCGSAAESNTAVRGRVNANGRGGWARLPLALGALGGIIPEPGEPTLLEFHGANCEHCDAMLPLMDRVRKLFRVEFKRHMVWEGSTEYKFMSLLDRKTHCRGLPFFYNTVTKQAICGATTWPNFRNWAAGEVCQLFLPPSSSPAEMLDMKPRSLKKMGPVEKLKAKVKAAMGKEDKRSEVETYGSEDEP
ncbi:unnamed protein product [Choristocarpus tenellus]